jgi:hypothetical protein
LKLITHAGAGGSPDTSDVLSVAVDSVLIAVAFEGFDRGCWRFEASFRDL